MPATHTNVTPAIDDRNFAALLARETERLLSYAKRLTDNPANAEDLLQDTMLRCWRFRSNFLPNSNFTAWARAVMRNGFLSDRRRARFQADISDDAFDRLLVVAQTQEWAVELRDLEWALSELPADHREAMRLVVQGLSIVEAAEQLRISTGAFKTRVFRGRARLRLLNEHSDTPRLTAAQKASPSRRRCGDLQTDTIG